MQKLVRQLYASAAIAGAALSPQVQAAVVTVNFDGPGLTGLYFAGDSFAQSGYTMTADFDAGIVDTAAALGGAAPSGNATQFYSGLNDGGLIMRRTDGGFFDLKGFDAAFIPLDPAAPGTTVMVAVGTHVDNSASGVAWLFGAKSGNAFPFLNYSNPLDFAGFGLLKQVEFFACSFDGTNVCNAPTLNNGQFAIDNINLNNIPEPSTTAMVALCMLGLALFGRRSAR